LQKKISILIKIHDLYFKPFLSAQEIAAAIDHLAYQLNRDLSDKKPIFLGILNGSYMVLADLTRKFTHECEVSFLRAKSYEGTSSTGVVELGDQLDINLAGRTVVIVEDIVDSGLTVETLLRKLKQHQPQDLKIATLFF
jgi:adenylate kinase